MSRTITAIFDSQSEADAAKMRLTSSRIDADNIRIIDQNASGSTGSSSSAGGQNKGFFDSLKDMFLPDEDAHAYGEGISRGGYLLCAQVDEDEADEAIRILDEAESVDFDQRQDEWRSQGWTGWAGRTDTGAVSGAGMGASGLGTAAMGGTSMESGSGMTSGQYESGRTVEEERIPIVEEELRVGKREVARGGARVRSYIRETPVHEQVSLREEQVSVERRPVDQRLSSADLSSGDMLREHDIEMTETAEEAVVGKEARVREELVVRKTAEERVEDIEETVRNTEVEVDEGLREDRPAFGFKGDASKSDMDRERSDFERDDKSRY
ncbi:YsnF/AvaK domain-containing protein [Allosphingosinicella flava]|uniref:YsnF/AvaK domain-containing protein n=1 Tax=Allosphingosinicella flava TaxID=2771430 RepID=A0A7T2GII0_9SPHN|nr:YsnF/AvaK domain-containing protein [Sphingosinicella flava]QPQ54469.1 YsnF/AvaK domain-containing protein [Sphingosinicella flava]